MSILKSTVRKHSQLGPQRMIHQRGHRCQPFDVSQTIQTQTHHFSLTNTAEPCTAARTTPGQLHTCAPLQSICFVFCRLMALTPSLLNSCATYHHASKLATASHHRGCTEKKQLFPTHTINQEHCLAMLEAWLQSNMLRLNPAPTTSKPLSNLNRESRQRPMCVDNIILALVATRNRCRNRAGVAGSVPIKLAVTNLNNTRSSK